MQAPHLILELMVVYLMFVWSQRLKRFSRVRETIFRRFLTTMKSLSCNWNLKRRSLSCGDKNWKNVRSKLKMKAESLLKRLRKYGISCLVLLWFHVPHVNNEEVKLFFQYTASSMLSAVEEHKINSFPLLCPCCCLFILGINVPF